MPDTLMRTVQVEGKAQISCKPDRVGFSFEISTLNAEYEKSYHELNSRLESLRKSLEKTGIAGTDLKTGSFDINYVDKNKSSHEITGYLGTHAVNLEIPMDGERIALVSDAIAASESVTGLSIYFLVEDNSRYRDQLLSAAVLKAKHNAEILSKGAGIILGPIMNINYSDSGPAFREDIAHLQSESMGISKSPAIRPKNITVSDTVTVVFGIKG